MSTKTNFLFLLILMAFNLQAQVFPVDTVKMTGSIDDRINLVFLPDGYQEHELEKFLDDVDWMMAALLGKDPYPAYKDYFNCFAIRVPSAVSGAANDPDSLINNYFGSTFNSSGIWRLVVPRRSSKVQAVLRDNFPAYDQVVVLVNDSRYGGSGGWMATSTTHTNGPEICIHEIGHSFAALADEYWAGSQYAREKINMTQETDPEKVRWANWLGERSTGIYAHAENTSWHRPHQNCEMRYLNREFCPVCQEAIASRILDLSSPILEYWPATNEFSFENEYIDFKVELLEPKPNTFRISWFLNNDSIAGHVDSLRIHANQLALGANKLVASILDTTGYIRKSSHSRMHSNRITWDFQGTTGIQNQISLDKMSLDLFPNPAQDHVTLNFSLEQNTELGITVIGITGKRIMTIPNQEYLPGNHQIQIDLQAFKLKPGFYYLVVQNNGLSTQLPLIIN